MAIPKAFVSYSHDDQAHIKWVMDLATRLMSSGVDVILDKWELDLGDDLPMFMEKHLASSDRVLMICTDRYVEKANSGAGGVGYEKMIITADLMQNVESNKVIPIIRQHSTHNVPTFLQTKFFINFSRDDEFEACLDELLGSLHAYPLYKKPAIGKNPFANIEEIRPERTDDPLGQVIKILVAAFEQGEEWVVLDWVAREMRISRTMCDVLLQKAEDAQLIMRAGEGDVMLTQRGKSYAVEHDLIE